MADPAAAAVADGGEAEHPADPPPYDQAAVSRALRILYASIKHTNESTIASAAGVLKEPVADQTLRCRRCSKHRHVA
jgi:hypothetical protein